MSLQIYTYSSFFPKSLFYPASSIYKNVQRRYKELASFDENNLSVFDEIQIPDLFFDRINHDYKGLEQKLATKMLLDLTKEKAKYIFKKPEFLLEILEEMQADFNKLSSFYFECIISQIDKNPIQVLFPNEVYSDTHEYQKNIRDDFENQEKDIEDLPF